MSVNGVSLNGVSLNGVSLNGVSLNGVSLNGVRLNGVSLNGASLNGVSLNGVRLNGVELVGAELSGQLATGAAVALRVDAITALPAPNADVLTYTVSYQSGTVWRPLCGTETSGAAIAAIPLSGRWNLGEGVSGGGSWIDDPASITFACRGAALAKCVELGYKPWTSRNGVPLRNHHQACTRMLRADYCGDGRPGTIDGWSVNVYDGLGIQARAPGTTWVYDASWSAAGATCVVELRLLELVTGDPVPACVTAKINQQCELRPFSTTMLVKNEQDTRGLVAIVRRIVNGNPGTRLADKVEDALHQIENAFVELERTPPDRLQAVGYLEGTMGDLETAVGAGGLTSTFGTGLMNRFTGLARQLVDTTVLANTCAPQVPAKLGEARGYLAQGDTSRAAGRYKEACARYKSAVGAAQDARGVPCP